MAVSPSDERDVTGSNSRGQSRSNAALIRHDRWTLEPRTKRNVKAEHHD